MSQTSVSLGECEALSQIPFVNKEYRQAAEKAGKQWAANTERKIDEGINAWNELMCFIDDNGEAEMFSNEAAHVFGVAIAALDEGRVRDEILMHTCEGTLEGLGSKMSSKYVEDTFMKLEQCVPDIDAIYTMCRILRLCCAYAAETQGYPFALMAYLLWWAGQYQYVVEYIGESLKRDRSNSLAGLLCRIVNIGIAPPWLECECGSLHTHCVE